MKSFKFSIAKCVLCKKKSLIENTSKICVSCAGKIKEAFSARNYEEKQKEILERGRGKWYFNLEKDPHGFDRYLLMFVPIAHWKQHDEFCEVHHLSEEDQEYLNYLPIDMGACDELAFELDDKTTPTKARKILLKLGLKELKDIN